MCDFSLESVKSRAAVDGEDLVVKKFGHVGASKGFVSPADTDCAVCCKSGMELTCDLIGEFSTHSLEDRNKTETEVFVGETAFVFYTSPETSFYRDGIITPRGRFLSLQYLPEGTKARVVKALSDELIETLKTPVAFDPDVGVEHSLVSVD